MFAASLSLDPAFTIASVSRRTFGSFVERMGRCVHTGIYEPGHRTADADLVAANMVPTPTASYHARQQPR